ncbi:MAG: nucleoside hydrolase [Anaerolineae bacterium]
MFAHTNLKQSRRQVCMRAFGGRRIAWVVLPLVVVVALLMPLSAAQAKHPPIELIIDTDPGVDDAAAIVWLLSQRRYPVEVLGIVTVAGNAAIENTTNNVLTLLDALSQPDLPVVMGAAEPLSQPMSHVSLLLHGPDGLWGVGFQNPHDLSGIPKDAPGFYCGQAAEHPGATVLALGPLTNLAQAVGQCPAEMRNFGQIIALGGSRTANAPQMDYNVWQDPEAAEVVLSAGIPLTLVLIDASGEFTLDDDNLQDLMEDGNPAAQLIAGPMQMYAQMQAGFGGATEIAYYDVAAAMYATKTSLGTAESALVKVVTEESLARGQTVIGLDVGERVTMIASVEELNMLVYQFYSDPDFDLMGAIFAILAREPDNAQVVLDIRERWMRWRFMRDMTW